MKTNTIEQVEEKMRAAIEKWSWIVMRYGWNFDVNYVLGCDNMPAGSDVNTTGATSARWEYLKGTIWINLLALQDESDDEIEKTAIHELFHLLLAPMGEVHNQTEKLEYTVTCLERLFFAVAHWEEK